MQFMSVDARRAQMSLSMGTQQCSLSTRTVVLRLRGTVDRERGGASEQPSLASDPVQKLKRNPVLTIFQKKKNLSSDETAPRGTRLPDCRKKCLWPPVRAWAGPGRAALKELMAVDNIF